MKNISLMRIVCMLVITIMLVPAHGVIADGAIDISVTHLSYIPGCTQTDEPFTIITNVTNNGNQDVANFTVTFIDKNTDTTLYTENITTLQAEATVILTLKWNATISNHIIIVMADNENDIVETNEDNNQDEILLTPSSQRDTTGDDQQTWREAESWDRSYDTNSGSEWNTSSYSTASNGKYTRQENIYNNGDYAEWDFNVYEHGVHYFWVRHWVDNYGCDEVVLQWNGDTIGSDSWYQATGGEYWEWTCFGTMTLSDGPGTLHLESQVWRLMETDNIAISTDPTFTPTGTGVEGSTNHIIGHNNPPVANDDNDIVDEDNSVWIDVLGNDYDSDGSLDQSTVTVTSGPSDGSTNVNTVTGEIRYMPDPEFSGSDSFTYTVDDNDGATSNAATVVISVTEVNDIPWLSNSYVSPGSGSTGTLFTYWVSYSDIDGSYPSKKRVYIDGWYHTMIYDSTYTNGIYLYYKYKYQTTLSVGNHNYYFIFGDGHTDVRVPDSGSYSGPSVSPANQPPTLVNHGTMPVGGDTSTVFTYRLTYTDPEGEAPTKKKVYIDDEGFDMIKVGGCYMTGAAYNYETTLPAGDHTYYFVFNDGYNPDVRLPVGTATYSGPHVQGVEIDLDYNYTWNVTKWLSTVYNRSYDEDAGDLMKGRAFGTQGEWDSADKIEFWMNELGLNPILESITAIDSLYDKSYYNELDDKLQVNAKGLKINNQPVDCYISPRWNNSMTHPNGDRTALSYNFTSPSDLKIYHKPMKFFDYFDIFLYDNKDDINNGDFDGFNSFLEFMIQEYEDYYGFSFENLNEENAFNISWFDEVYGQYSSVNCRRNYTLGCSPFVYIGEDPAFNPDASVPEYYSYINALTRPWVEAVAGQIERLIWHKTLYNCHGLVLYDFNDHTYDMNLEYLMALPTIYINGSIGKEINQSIGDYTLDFYVDQEWNDNVVSYNVIGQINGTNQDETVIVCCLYDSWWNQGTADSAIGIGMVLAIAKYYIDNDITPERNIKFIAFGGEEYGMRGAFHYEAAHLTDETVTTVIDLNQLGFTQANPRLTLNVISNSDRLNDVVSDIVDDTNYVERTGNVADLRTITTGEWNVISDYKPFSDACLPGYRQNQPRSCGTICFVKDRGENPQWRWTLHHRDGKEHTKGDVIDYYNKTDVQVTAEMILNVTKYFVTESVPLLNYAPSSHHNFGITIGTLDSTSFDIWNSGTDTLSYNLAESCSWVTVSPMSGTSTGEHDTITVSIDTSELSSGLYDCDVLISSNSGSGVFTINVIVIDIPDCMLAYDPSSYNFGYMYEGNDLTTFDIWNDGTGTLTYSLSESCSWVDISPTGSTSSGEHDTITVGIDTTRLAVGSHQCDIQISSNGGSGVFTVYVNVVRPNFPPYKILPLYKKDMITSYSKSPLLIVEQ